MYYNYLFHLWPYYWSFLNSFSLKMNCGQINSVSSFPSPGLRNHQLSTLWKITMIRQAWGDLNYQLTKMLQGIPSSHHHGGWALGWKVPETLNATFTASSTDKICPLWLRERKGLMYQNTILALKDMSAIAVITVKHLGRFQSEKSTK